MPIDECIICPKPKYFYYLLKGSALKRAGARGQEPEARRPAQVGWEVFPLSFSPPAGEPEKGLSKTDGPWSIPIQEILMSSLQ
jgi:hypothetical protein